LADNIVIIEIRGEIADLKKKLDESRKEIDKFSESSRKMNDDIKRTTKEGFNEQIESIKKNTDSLIAMGNIAGSVDRIMDSYANLQLRIENAELRVIDARSNLNKLTEEGKQGTEEYEAATRRLQIAENGLERTNNAVVGTYINMSVQILTLATSLPKAISGVYGMVTAVKALDITTKAFLMTSGIGLVILATSMIIPSLKKTEEQVDSNTEAINQYNLELNKIPKEISTNIELSGVGKFITGMGEGFKEFMGIITEQIAEQYKMIMYKNYRPFAGSVGEFGGGFGGEWEGGPSLREGTALELATDLKYWNKEMENLQKTMPKTIEEQELWIKSMVEVQTKISMFETAISSLDPATKKVVEDILRLKNAFEDLGKASFSTGESMDMTKEQFKQLLESRNRMGGTAAEDINRYQNQRSDVE